MSSILEAIAAEQAAFRKGPTCSIGQMLDTLDAKERAAVEAAAPVEDAAATESWPLHADTAIDSGPQPFGFRPTPDPWPPSWE